MCTRLAPRGSSVVVHVEKRLHAYLVGISAQKKWSHLSFSRLMKCQGLQAPTVSLVSNPHIAPQQGTGVLRRSYQARYTHVAAQPGYVRPR